MNLSEENILKLMRQKAERPMKFSELVKKIGVPEARRREFRAAVKGMVKGGSLIKLRGGRYGLPDEMQLVSGTLSGHPDGYGFLVTEGDEDDIFIPRKHMGEAMHRDHVMARIEGIKKGFNRAEGRIVRVIEHKTKSLVGVFEPLGPNGWVAPSEQKYFHNIFVAEKDKKGAKPRHMVCVDIVEYPTKNHPPIGKITEILGFSDDPDVELRSIFHKHNARLSFPPKVMSEVRKITSDISAEERKSRLDLTGEMIFTIDGESAKDFDDAVSLEPIDGNLRLGVHIADVSHYVAENTEVFQEAYERATSIYYPDGVIPMLPFELSNDICSLKPGVERLTLSVFIDYDKSGDVLGHEIFPSIIKSKHRFTYNQVAGMLEKGDPKGEFQDALPTLQAMLKLSQTLRKQRFKNGSVNFNIPEPLIHLNEKGHVDRITIAEHNVAHELIEEFMLAANQEVAKHLFAKEIPSIHRIHEPPDEEKLALFNDFVDAFGLRLPSTSKLKSSSLQKFLEKVQGRPEERAVNTVLLRTMKKAIYSEKDPGHYALGFQHYTHFTSPIRRFPDLITHGSVKKFLKNKKITLREKKRIRPRIAEFGEQSTQMEIKAMLIEREVNDLRRCQYMEDKIGNEYHGIITSVTAFGLFVELAEVFVEGLVHISALADDYYIYHESEHALKGQRLRKKYKIGDKVKVRLKHVDISKRQIDLNVIP